MDQYNINYILTHGDKIKSILNKYPDLFIDDKNEIFSINAIIDVNEYEIRNENGISYLLLYLKVNDITIYGMEYLYEYPLGCMIENKDFSGFKIKNLNLERIKSTLIDDEFNKVLVEKIIDDLSTIKYPEDDLSVFCKENNFRSFGKTIYLDTDYITIEKLNEISRLVNIRMIHKDEEHDLAIDFEYKNEKNI